MKYLKILGLASCALLFTACSNSADVSKAKLQEDLKAKEQLGKVLYFDKNLSKNRTQACSTCHNPEFGFVDNRDNGVGAAVSLGDDGKSLGDRTAPSAAYAKFSPKFHYDERRKNTLVDNSGMVEKLL